MNGADEKIVVVAAIALILLAIFVMFADSENEKKRCVALEKRIGINLVYTFSDGCKLASDL